MQKNPTFTLQKKQVKRNLKYVTREENHIKMIMQFAITPFPTHTKHNHRISSSSNIKIFFFFNVQTEIFVLIELFHFLFYLSAVLVLLACLLQMIIINAVFLRFSSSCLVVFLQLLLVVFFFCIQLPLSSLLHSQTSIFKHNKSSFVFVFSYIQFFCHVYSAENLLRV